MHTTAPPVRPRSPARAHLLAVALGGAIGGALRYGLVLAFPSAPGELPWVILSANVAGAFLLGVVLTVTFHGWRGAWDPRPFLTAGVLSSFTTFSNFTLDVVLLGEQEAMGTAVLYSLMSMGLGVAAAAAGIALGRTVAGGQS